MPKTRSDLTRTDKEAEIVDAAVRRLHEGGYQALSVAAIARELGRAQNAIYWYYPTKDHLFVAALERLLRSIAAGRTGATDDPIERVLGLVAQLDQISALRPAMAERAEQAEVVATFVAQLDELIGRMLANAFRGLVAPAEMPYAVQAFRAAVEGTIVQHLSDADRRTVLTYLLTRLFTRG